MQFAFVTLALSEVLPEGSIDDSNIGCGSLCPVPPGLNPDTMLPGILFITKVRSVRWLVVVVVLVMLVTCGCCCFLFVFH